MNLIETIQGSYVEKFYPSGWDFAKIDQCVGNGVEDASMRQEFWHEDFKPIACESLDEFGVLMGHEIAMEIKNTYDSKIKLALILPVGPMGMYKWVAFFVKQWKINCDHVYTFNMDEWSDKAGNTLEGSKNGSFQYAMEKGFFDLLEDRTVPSNQRYFATKESLPTYSEKIHAIKDSGGRLVTVYGIGRAFHIAFWEPHFAEDYETDEDWLKAEYRIGAELHPLTLEQNAITSYKSRTTLMSAYANTVGPGLYYKSDRMIGGCDGILGRGMQWQGLSFWVTLRHGPTRWATSTYVPTKPGVLYYLKDLAGPLEPESN
ncbi:MAG: glucosamine-6-phosphate isomerase [Clostridiaceae bacterium]|nr:glucosamine-6-phosphate isomerase [Clostridiaceae bacterium]